MSHARRRLSTSQRPQYWVLRYVIDLSARWAGGGFAFERGTDDRQPRAFYFRPWNHFPWAMKQRWNTEPLPVPILLLEAGIAMNDFFLCVMLGGVSGLVVSAVTLVAVAVL